MAARRTRSLSELPGHLRVPILRRKDTQRTKERLAAGLAGMEELRSLRQQHQQLVGETVAKAEDKRQERKQGGGGGGEWEFIDDGLSMSSMLNGSTLSSTQSLLSPRQPVPHPRSCSYRRQSMDSILEEGDSLTHGYPGSKYGSRRYQHVDTNNNDSKNDNNAITTNDKFHKSQTDHNTNDESDPWYCNGQSSDSLNQDRSPHDTQAHHVSVSEKHIYQKLGNETRLRRSTRPTESEQNSQTGLNPSPYIHENDETDFQTYSHREGIEIEGRGVSDAPTPSRRRSLSSQESPIVCPRQRSMSLDMGHGRPTPTTTHIPTQPPHQSDLSKNGHLHNRFSSLTSINQREGHDLDKNDSSQTSGYSSLSCNEEGQRLSQSMTQINNVGNSPRGSMTTLTRRGSLTWDSLLKSIGIKNNNPSNESPSENAENSNQNSDAENEDQQKVDEKDGDTFHTEMTPSRIDENILINRKKGRSMSFTCGNNTAPLLNINPASYRMNLPRQTPMVADHSLGVSIDKNTSQETSAIPTPSIHPIMRRASIQCEAVLTRTNRVVNPIQDVDVNSFNSPGPLHAVMLQYRGYNNSPGVRSNINKATNVAVTTPHKSPVTHSPDTQQLPNRCLPTRVNTAKRSLSYSTKNSSESTSPLCVQQKGAISVGLAVPGGQEKGVCNVTSKQIKNAPLSECGDNNMSGECQNTLDNFSSSVDVNKLVNGCVDDLTSRVMPDLNEESEAENNSPTETRAMEEAEGESDSRTMLPHNLSDVNDHMSGMSCDQLSSAASDSRHSSSVIDRENEDQQENNNGDTPNGLSKLSKSNTRERNDNNRENNVNGNMPNSKKVLDTNSVRTKDKQESDSFSDPNSLRIETFSNGYDCDLLHKPHFTKSSNNNNPPHPHYQDNILQHSDYDITQNGHPMPTQTSTLAVHGTNNNGKLFQTVTQSSLGQHNSHNNIDEVDLIRNKRSSIFSDVSVMSDLSSKTPSSCASVFSDMSMISDEGYQTCESTSPDNKMAHLKRLSSASSSHLVTAHCPPNMSRTERDIDGISNVQNRTVQFAPRDCNGNSIVVKGNLPQSISIASQHNGNFRYEKETAGSDQRPPIANVKPIHRPNVSNANDGQSAIEYKKSFKQTTV